MKRSAKTPHDKGMRVVTADEALLWHHATKSLDPIAAKPRVDAASNRFEPASGANPVPQLPAPSPSKSHSSKSPPSGANHTPALRPRTGPPRRPSRSPASSPPRSPPLADFDRRKARQIAAGKAEVDAHLDLHGLDQRAAYLRLRGFIASAHARGDRLVLVITGKGGETLDRLGELAGGSRGVLRRNLPGWLEQPEFRDMVSSFTQAGARHGGAGALYVQLRRGR
jgi:DNA-nicking Smr family endonuclease